MKVRGIICDDMSFASPPGETECRLACFTKGRSCGTCERDDCYRQGWPERLVTLDNAGRVAEKNRRYLAERAAEGRVSR
jgi:hypothetical protein